MQSTVLTLNQSMLTLVSGSTTLTLIWRMKSFIRGKSPLIRVTITHNVLECLNLFNKCLTLTLVDKGGRHITAVGFALLTQPFRVRFPHLTAVKNNQNRTQKVLI